MSQGRSIFKVRRALQIIASIGFEEKSNLEKYKPM